jgi:hypothetical protein
MAHYPLPLTRGRTNLNPRHRRFPAGARTSFFQGLIIMIGCDGRDASSRRRLSTMYCNRDTGRSCTADCFTIGYPSISKMDHSNCVDSIHGGLKRFRMPKQRAKNRLTTVTNRLLPPGGLSDEKPHAGMNVRALNFPPAARWRPVLSTHRSSSRCSQGYLPSVPDASMDADRIADFVSCDVCRRGGRSQQIALTEVRTLLRKEVEWRRDCPTKLGTDSRHVPIQRHRTSGDQCAMRDGR